MDPTRWLDRLDRRVFPKRSPERTRGELLRLAPLIAAVAVGVVVASDVRRALIPGSGVGVGLARQALTLGIVLAFLIVFLLMGAVIANVRARRRSRRVVR